MEHMTASGTVAVGRQAAASPVTSERTILLGSRRHAVVEAVVKGARPEIKVRLAKLARVRLRVRVCVHAVCIASLRRLHCCKLATVC
jgi:hypothetical protein